MSRTQRIKDDQRGSCFTKEKKEYRKRNHKQYKQKIKKLINQERFDDIYQPRKTSGWLTH